ncbi:EAL and HDOD domain-containing protein [Cellulomonas endophytica]|uniref:EAL and HDOD domain-containing protein n=1 Tax=Cellulomonas endophytica TaxID=2494735 RepID=UPI001012102A|nr:HDOD domain-containing protein [Cellulomonas endophytica]
MHERIVAALPSAAQVVCVAVQPLYDRAGRVAAQELLFRPAPGALTAGEGFDDDMATARVLSAVTTEFDPHVLAGDAPLFVNLPRRFLTGELPVPLDPENTVLEVLERVEPDEDVRAGIEALRDEGFRIALDDVVPGDRRAVLLPLADVVKVDLRDCPPEGLPAMVAWLRMSCGRPVQLVAERIETAEDLALATAAGFDLFQGYHLRRPSVVERSSLSHSSTTALRLLAQLADPSAGWARIADLVAADPAISLKVLRACNSAAGARRRVRTLHQAVVLLGHARLRSMLVLELVAGTGHGDDDLALRCLARVTAAERLVPQDARTAATEEVVRLVSELLGQTREQVEEVFGHGEPGPDVRAACDALDAYLVAEGGEAPVPADPRFTALGVSSAYLAALAHAHELLATGEGGPAGDHLGSSVARPVAASA